MTKRQQLTEILTHLAFIGACFGTFLSLINHSFVYLFAYGWICISTGIIAITFLINWLRSGVPSALALWITFFGASWIMGYWWLRNLVGHLPVGEWLAGNDWTIYIGTSMALAGYLAHFQTFEQSIPLRKGSGFVLFLSGGIASIALALWFSK